MQDNFDLGIVNSLEKKLGYKFQDIKLLQEALSHPSLKQLNKKKKHLNYERMELLGDAVLGLIIVEELYTQFTELDEGNLAKIKAYLISKEVISEISAKKLQLSNFILMTKGEENSGGRTNPSNLENALEAIIAAIYLDSDLGTVKKIVLNLWKNYIHEFDQIDIDPKSTLQEWSQKAHATMPVYSVLSQVGPVHSPNFEVAVMVEGLKALGMGNSIKLAEKAAAREFLKQIDYKNINK